MVEHQGVMRRALQPFFVLGVYLFLYLPIVVLVLFSFNSSQVSIEWTGFSLRWYQNILHNQELLEAAKVSCIVAFMSSCLSVSLATFFVMISYWWHAKNMHNLFIANVLLPDIALAIALMTTFSYFNISLGYVSLVAGHSLIGLGFAVPVLRARLAEFDASLIEASLDLGATQWQTCKHIIIPLLKPGIIAAFLLVFTLSLDDFMISFFCSGPTVQTLSVYVYYQVRTLVDPSVNAISTCFLAVSSFIVLLLCYLRVINTALFHD